MFSHCSVQLGEAAPDALAQALRAAWAGQPAAPGAEDLDAVYRTIEFRDGGQALLLRAAYVGGVGHPGAPAFEAAWALLERQFPVAGSPGG
jgi:hypothetical protein